MTIYQEEISGNIRDQVSKEVAEEIRRQIKTLDGWALPAWGAEKLRVIKQGAISPSQRQAGFIGSHHLGGLGFHVKGATFQGDIQVILNGSDYYNIMGYSDDGQRTFAFIDVVAFDLVKFLDKVIEQGSDSSALQDSQYGNEAWLGNRRA